MSRARFAAPLILALLSACSILPKAESPHIYTLPAAPGGRPAAPAQANWALRITAPSAPRALDNSRIAVMPGGNTITVYAAARWADSVPNLFRDRLADAFRDSGRVSAISTDDANLAADYELGGNLAAFQTEYVDAKPTVVIRYDATLSGTRRHQIVASRRFEISEPVEGKDVPQVVEAFGRAMNRLSGEVVGWTMQSAPAR
ncbi:cholesterol transport system auxiliary component [Luteibacter sp. UNCMF331Sha3.1]|uniref:ABC-type transport auxiliary lipoprotein family protein n=1 Tax=Luteibacter sp. UNCMF331Sha3.1 TaxID=1502760 RepID=UPI0008BFFFF1|nr:ABC-type transport auxiliary lipoprotein family protein [Luteibacter sp. UNCMF331Sha3.1]SEM33622.1 cholesterol transport system auxiliary component [Luteibacter sp. UNCMF331Sha3.1]